MACQIGGDECPCGMQLKGSGDVAPSSAEVPHDLRARPRENSPLASDATGVLSLYVRPASLSVASWRYFHYGCAVMRKASFWVVTLALGAMVLAGCSGSSQAPSQSSFDVPLESATISVSEIASSVGRYDIYELTVAHDDSLYENPWKDVELSMRFTNPGGQDLSVDGFYYDVDRWKVRFSPPEDGNWTWNLTFATPRDTVTRTGSFFSEPSGRPGFVRRHPENPFRLVFDDGSLFNAIGIGDCVLDRDGNGRLDEWGLDGDFRPAGQHEGWTVDLDTYMSTYGASGAGFNLFRWSVGNCAFDLWDWSAEGYRALAREGMLGDALVKALRQNGFRIWMTIFGAPHAGDHAVGQALPADPRPYLDYAVARYGAYVDIWELTNESKQPDTWITLAAEYLRSIDPYHRLITTSWQRPELPRIDINSPHWYEKEPELESDLVTSRKIAHERRWGKPIIFGEQGNAVQNWDERSALRMRLRSWTAFFEEGVLIFWNTSGMKDYKSHGAANIYLGPEERSYIRVLQDFTSGVDHDVVRFPLEAANGAVRAYGLRSPRVILGYLHHFRDHDTPVTATVTLDLPTDGTVFWIDPATGSILGESRLTGGRQTLTTPVFAVDLALQIPLDSKTGTD